MDFSSGHVPYVLWSYALTAIVFLFSFYSSVREDRKIQQQLKKLASDAT